MVRRPTALLLLLPLLLSACSQPPAQKTSVDAFGRQVELTVRGLSPERASQALHAAADDVRFVEEVTHPWHPGPLGRTNQLLATGGTFSANPSLLPLLRRARTLSIRSGGLFNPALGHLLDLWGFHQPHPHGPPPSQAAIERRLAYKPSMAAIVSRGIRMHSTNTAVKLDFGAMARGYALDVALRTLQAHGATEAAARLGASLRASGRNGNAPWRVTIPGPDTAPLAVLEPPPGLAVYTFDNRGRGYNYKGQHYAPPLDPRTGRPARGLRSVTVVADEAADAAAIATALFVAGPGHWQSEARRLRADRVLVVDGKGRVHMSPAMSDMAHTE